MPFTMPKWGWYAIGAALAALALYLAITAYGNSRYREGVSDTDAKWAEASERLKAKAAESATRADDAAAVRLEEFKQQVEDEERELEEAKRTGGSPWDVLFN